MSKNTSKYAQGYEAGLAAVADMMKLGKIARDNRFAHWALVARAAVADTFQQGYAHAIIITLSNG